MPLNLTPNLSATLTAQLQAELSRIAAEAARDAANTAGRVFADTTAGLAGTTNGQAFSVFAGNFCTQYRNDAGVATQVGQFYVKSYFDALFPQGYTSSRIGYLHAWLDSAGRLLAGIKSNGDLESKGVNVSQTMASAALAISYATPSTDVVMFGDSLVEGTGATAGQSVAEQLKALYVAAGDARTVYKSGYGGQGCASILARLGPVPALVTLPTGASGFPEIPASGAVNVTVTKAPLAYADPAQAKSMTGTLAGIPGTLTKAATTGQYSFTRTAAGSIVVCDTAIPFEPDTQAHRLRTLVPWIGTNDLLGSTPAQILDFIGQYLSWQAPTQKRRVVVLPAIDCLSGSVATLKANYASLLALVKEAYPYEYVDTLSLLQRHNDGSGNDLADVAAGLPPRSLLAGDRYHLNTAGYGYVAADIKRILDSKGF